MQNVTRKNYLTEQFPGKRERENNVRICGNYAIILEFVNFYLTMGRQIPQSDYAVHKCSNLRLNILWRFGGMLKIEIALGK